jgi:hypothetical protein
MKEECGKITKKGACATESLGQGHGSPRPTFPRVFVLLLISSCQYHYFLSIPETEEQSSLPVSTFDYNKIGLGCSKYSLATLSLAGSKANANVPNDLVPLVHTTIALMPLQRSKQKPEFEAKGRRLPNGIPP